MRVAYRILSIRFDTTKQDEKPFWAPVGVIFCANQTPTVRNVFIKRSIHTVPSLPIILQWPDRFFSENFNVPGIKLPELFINDRFAKYVVLDDVAGITLNCDPQNISGILFQVFLREHPDHKDRKPLYSFSYLPAT